MKKKGKISLLLGIGISVLFTAIFLLISTLMTVYLVSIYMNDSSTVGIIGGADGPTTIYASSPLGVPLFYPVMILGFIGMLHISILLIQYYRKSKKEELG